MTELQLLQHQNADLKNSIKLALELMNKACSERDALLVYVRDAENWFNKHDPQGYVSPKQSDAQTALAAHDAEVAKAAYISGASDYQDADSVHENFDFEDRAEKYVAQLLTKTNT